MRPERAVAQTSDEAAVGPAPVVMLARRSVPATSAPQPPPPPPPQVRPPARQQTSAESLVISGVTSYRHIVGQPRSSRLTILTPGGQLLDGVVRKHLSQLDCRSCIGVLGRPSAGKSMVLSRLASREFVEESMELFPLATEENKIGTLGVDFWVTPARIILVDAPPMVSVASSEVRAKLLNDPRGSSRLSALRARDLQLATLLIRVSSVLLVFADRGDGVDEGLAKLLVDARELLNQFPGPKHHNLLSSRTYPHYGKQCKLHIVINTGAAPFGADAGKGIGENLGELARAYEEATEFIVCGVSVIPSRCPPPVRPANRLVQGSAPRFLQVAESWLTTPTLPLYPPPLDLSKPGAGEQCRRSLLCWPPHSSAGNHPACGTFEEAVDKLRAGLLAPPPMAGWDEKPVGEWMNTCLKVWDAIRRSHKLRDTASMF
ncbi:smg-9, nonsense mediated mRNA decay factor [Coemansia sp. RSA 1694]|nr:smg-9, nonsense mediated mRNA decay factor [Coemansia sp. RSA 1694]